MGENVESEILKRELPHSVELQRAKDGTYYWVIKRYFATGEEVSAVADIKEIDAMLRVEFLKGE